jgi:hypothetical protein
MAVEVDVVHEGEGETVFFLPPSLPATDRSSLRLSPLATFFALKLSTSQTGALGGRPRTSSGYPRKTRENPVVYGSLGRPSWAECLNKETDMTPSETEGDSRAAGSPTSATIKREGTAGERVAGHRYSPQQEIGAAIRLLRDEKPDSLCGDLIMTEAPLGGGRKSLGEAADEVDGRTKVQAVGSPSIRRHGSVLLPGLLPVDKEHPRLVVRLGLNWPRGLEN